MSQIKIYDKVICISNWKFRNIEFVVGKIYTIERIFSDSYVVDNTLFYNFSYYFIPLKELRKQKLQQLNECNMY